MTLIGCILELYLKVGDQKPWSQLPLTKLDLHMIEGSSSSWGGTTNVTKLLGFTAASEKLNTAFVL